MHQWGDPYADRIDDIQVSDPVQVKRSVPMHAGRSGWCIAIRETGDYTVLFQDGETAVYDQDNLLKLEADNALRWLMEQIRQKLGNVDAASLITGYIERSNNQ